MEAELTDQLGIQVELIKGDIGVFDVATNGQLLFSKHEENRFPETAEVVTALRDLL